MRANPFLLLLLLPLLAKADPKLSPYEELCQYDRLCTRLRNSDGSRVEAKPAVKKLLETMADPIHDFSKLYEVDPRAVAGTILAENSMNVQIDDEIQNWIVKNNIWGSKAALDAGMTIGPGQINLAPALSADIYIASLGLRPARSPDEIKKLLLTPAGAAEYSAAILRQAQDAYKAEGIDISKDPGILVTLYNLGQKNMSYSERAKEAAKLRIKPRPNFFGLFVTEQIDAVEDAIGWSPEKGRFKKGDTELYTQGSLNLVTGDLQLQTAPPSCSTIGAGDEGQWRARLSWEPFQKFTPRRSKYIELVGRGVDCQMRDWLQVKTSDGEIGWMPKSALSSVSTPLKNWQLTVSSCGASETGGCLEKATALYGQAKLDGRDNQGRYFLSVKKYDPNDPVDPIIRPLGPEGPRTGCEEVKYFEYKKRLNEKLSSTRNTIQREELYALKEKIVKKHNALKELLGIKDQYEDVPVEGVDWGNSSSNGTSLYGAPQGAAFGAPGSMGGISTQGSYQKPATTKRKLPSNNYFVQRLEKIEENINSCLGSEKTVCQASSESIASFKKILDTDLEKITTLKAFRSWADLLDSFYLSPTLNAAEQTAREMEEQKWRQETVKENRTLFLAANESCKKIEGSFPKLHTKIMAALADAQALLDSDNRLSSVFAGFQRACEQAWLLDEFKKNGNRLPDGSSAFNCTYEKNNLGELDDFSLDFLAKMNLSSEDYSEMLKGQFSFLDSIKNFHQASVSQYSNGIDEAKKKLANCNYNPLATAQAVEELAKSECVETILVKDMSLGKNIGARARARVVLDTKIDASQIAFTLKNDCRSEILGRPRNQPKSPFNGGNKE